MQIYPVFCSSNLQIFSPLDPQLDPIEKHITYGVSISLKLLQTMLHFRDEILTSTAFSKNDPLSKKLQLIPVRIVELSLLAGATASLFVLQVVEVAARIICLIFSRILLIALLYDWYKGDPCFTNPIGQIPPQVGYTVLVGASSLLASLYAAKEMLFPIKQLFYHKLLIQQVLASPQKLLTGLITTLNYGFY